MTRAFRHAHQVRTYGRCAEGREGLRRGTSYEASRIFGYSEHLGLHSVDRQTFVRTPKPSAAAYAEIARSGGASTPLPRGWFPRRRISPCPEGQELLGERFEGGDQLVELAWLE